jgi:hypothetical protein
METNQRTFAVLFHPISSESGSLLRHTWVFIIYFAYLMIDCMQWHQAPVGCITKSPWNVSFVQNVPNVPGARFVNIFIIKLSSSSAEGIGTNACSDLKSHPTFISGRSWLLLPLGLYTVALLGSLSFYILCTCWNHCWLYSEILLFKENISVYRSVAGLYSNRAPDSKHVRHWT